MITSMRAFSYILTGVLIQLILTESKGLPSNLQEPENNTIVLKEGYQSESRFENDITDFSQNDTQINTNKTEDNTKQQNDMTKPEDRGIENITNSNVHDNNFTNNQIENELKNQTDDKNNQMSIEDENCIDEHRKGNLNNITAVTVNDETIVENKNHMTESHDHTAVITNSNKKQKEVSIENDHDIKVAEDEKQPSDETDCILVELYPKNTNNTNDTINNNDLKENNDKIIEEHETVNQIKNNNRNNGYRSENDDIQMGNNESEDVTNNCNTEHVTDEFSLHEVTLEDDKNQTHNKKLNLGEHCNSSSLSKEETDENTNKIKPENLVCITDSLNEEKMCTEMIDMDNSEIERNTRQSGYSNNENCVPSLTTHCSSWYMPTPVPHMVWVYNPYYSVPLPVIPELPMMPVPEMPVVTTLPVVANMPVASKVRATGKVTIIGQFNNCCSNFDLSKTVSFTPVTPLNTYDNTAYDYDNTDTNFGNILDRNNNSHNSADKQVDTAVPARVKVTYVTRELVDFLLRYLHRK